MIRTLVIITMLASMVGCSAPDRSTAALEDAGFTEIKMHGWAPWLCAKDDTFTTQFSARNPKGDRVEGVVCCGWVKGCTIRH